MAIADVLMPVAVILLAIAAVAAVYCVCTALKDCSLRKRDEDLMRQHRARR